MSGREPVSLTAHSLGADGGNPDYIATAASEAVAATECTGTATDGTSTCDLDASTDGTADCPAGCDNDAVSAIAVGDTVSCGFAPIVEIIADHADWPAPGWYENSDAFSIRRAVRLANPKGITISGTPAR